MNATFYPRNIPYGLHISVHEFKETSWEKPARIACTIYEESKEVLNEVCDRLGFVFFAIHEPCEDENCYWAMDDFEFDTFEEALEALDETVQKIEAVRKEVREKHGNNLQ